MKKLLSNQKNITENFVWVKNSQSGLPALTKSVREQAGMTLIELIVVIAIVSIVSGVLMFNYSGFSTTASIRNLAQEIALAIRKSQIYATSVIRSPDESQTIYGSYGISFSKATVSANTEPNTKQFVLFADIPASKNGFYDSPGATCGGSSECLEVLSINSSDKIVKAEACDSSNLCTEALSGDSIDVLFQRPSPDAYICLKRGTSCIAGPFASAKITVESAKGLSKIISVWNTGQIRIQ